MIETTKTIKHKIKNFSDRILTLIDILQYKNKKKRLIKINSQLDQNNIWENPEYAKLLGREYSLLKEIINKIDNIIYDIKYVNDFLELILEENDINYLSEIKKILENIDNEIKKIEFYKMFPGEYDSYNCYIDIRAGSGGIDAQDWTFILYKMYLRWINLHKFKAEVIEKNIGEKVGLKSITIKVIGNYAYGWLHTETGIHRLVRKSPFDSNNRRHTSFSSVFVYPELSSEFFIKINSTDIRIDVYKSSGSGGQHVNTTESAVRITHIPTNIVVQCQDERSQHKNKNKAMKQLEAKLYKLEIEKQKKNKKIIENNKKDICWSNQIRSYIIDNSFIKDLRTGVESYNIQSVFNGHLDQFIKASLKLGL